MREYRSGPALRSFAQKRSKASFRFLFSLRRIFRGLDVADISPLLAPFAACYTIAMQPDDNKSFQDTQVSDAERGPAVTLSPDEDQPVYIDDSPVDADTMPSSDEPIRWQATEYVHNEKNHLWFLLFIVVTLGLMGVAMFIIKSISFTILLPVMAAALFTYTRRPPRTLDYTLSRQGLHINDQLYGFGEFKSFALVYGLERNFSIMLIPVKRFKPAVTVNFPEEVGEAIVDMLAARLPMREIQPDVIDRIIRKLHL